jgi:hypothetical protein
LRHEDLYHAREVNMNNVRKEVRELISLNEKIQSALLHGDHITDDEATLIRQCAGELLEKVPAPPRTWTTASRALDGGVETQAGIDNRS